MRSTSLLRVAGVVGVVAVLGVASCSHNDPESFCQGWVESTCQALTTCCQSGTKFDPNECRLSLSSSCQEATQATKVEAGEAQFDSGAASTCMGTVSSCADFAALSAKPTTYAVQQACANMVTGFTPVGAACNGAGECEKEGDFSTCYGGGTNTGGTAAGVCAKVVQDQMTCSFSFSTLELHVCPDNLFCDRVATTPTTGEPPSMEQFEFTASCKPPIAAGKPCSPLGQSLPCATGLFCQVTTFNGPDAMGTCVAPKPKGAACQPTDVCATGLECLPSPTGTGGTCQAVGNQVNSPFCFSPTSTGPTGPAGPQCGDGICEPPETAQTCPQDC